MDINLCPPNKLLLDQVHINLCSPDKLSLNQIDINLCPPEKLLFNQVDINLCPNNFSLDQMDLICIMINSLVTQSNGHKVKWKWLMF